MTLTESAIEQLAIESGNQYIYGPDIASDNETPEWAQFEDVLLLEHLRKAAGRN